MHPQRLSFNVIIHFLPFPSIHPTIDPSKCIHLFALSPFLLPFILPCFPVCISTFLHFCVHPTLLLHYLLPLRPSLRSSVHSPSPFLPLPTTLLNPSTALSCKSPSPYNLSSHPSIPLHHPFTDSRKTNTRTWNKLFAFF